MNKVAFIGNFYKTAVYEAIANSLKKYDIESFWIIPNGTQYQELRDRYGDDHVLLIDRSIINRKSNVVGDFKINEIVYGDRIWKYEMQTGIDYLTSIQKPILDFISRNNINTVFGENTTSEELLICRMCHDIPKLDCNFYSVMTARIPDNRFFVFTDEKQTQVWKSTSPQISSSDLDFQVKKPSYLALNNKILEKKMSAKGLIQRLKFFVTDEHIDYQDPNVLTKKSIRFKVKSKEVLNQQLYRFVKRYPYNYLDGKKYIFFGFHKQPESSIDVCGRYNENQEQSIINIWRQLPPDWYLVIKEHTNAIGDRSLSYYKKIENYPRIILINEKIDSKLLIKDAQLVITNTGTMGLESALMGIPAITLSKVVFNCLNYCRYMTWQDFEKYSSIEALINEIKSLGMNNSDFENLVKNYSFEGKMGDTFGTPLILQDSDNIEKLARSFSVVISEHENKNTI